MQSGCKTKWTAVCTFAFVYESLHFATFFICKIWSWIAKPMWHIQSLYYPMIESWSIPIRNCQERMQNKVHSTLAFVWPCKESCQKKRVKVGTFRDHDIIPWWWSQLLLCAASGIMYWKRGPGAQSQWPWPLVWNKRMYSLVGWK